MQNAALHKVHEHEEVNQGHDCVTIARLTIAFFEDCTPEFFTFTNVVIMR